MPDLEVEIELGGTVAVARLNRAAAPATCEAVASLLPCSTTAHYAKIAGNEFYLYLPLVLDVERACQVSVLSRGSVVFWPERQLLCVYYGRIQDEDATVTFLGQVVRNLEALAAAGAELQRPGTGAPRLVQVRSAAGEGPAARQPTGHAPRRTLLASRVTAAYAAITQRPPDEVSALLARRGVMRPAGPLLYAEAETRKLHETLWLVRQETRDRRAVPSFASSVLRHFAGRLRGWYQLDDAAAMTEEVAGAILALPSADALELVEALMLYIGRLNLWLDASIPWSDFNRLVAE